MFKNYFLVALRNLIKNKLFSFVNIFGLSLSLSICLLVMTIMYDQNSFDLFHPKSADIFRINTIAIRKTGGTEPYASSPFLLGPLIREENINVRNTVRLVRGLSGEVKAGDAAISISGFFTEPSFFDVFGFELSMGDPITALQQPSGIVLSDELAKKLFGSQRAYGQYIKIGNIGEFQVTGVMKPVPGKTHLEFDALGSVTALPAIEKKRKAEESITDRWTNYYQTYTYVLMQPGYGAEYLSKSLEEIPKRVYGNIELETRDAGYRFEVQSLDEITPGPLLSNALGRGLPLAILIFLSVLAGIGMFAAIFNYVNLTLSRALSRAREIGIRKVHGATRPQIFIQFVGESMLLSLLAFALSEITLYLILIPGFQSLTFTRAINLDLLVPPFLYLYFFFFVMLVGFLAGCIPAGVLSSFKTMTVLKDASKVKVFPKLTLRKIILFFQFGFTFVLLIVLTMIDRQSEYSMNLNYYGFEWDRVINIDPQGQSIETLSHEMSSYSGVESCSAISDLMGTWQGSRVDVYGNLDKEPIPTMDYSIDEGFISTMKIHLVSGKNFTPSNILRDEIIVNQKFLERFEIPPGEAIGKIVFLEKKRPVQIIGVMKDFLFKPLTYELEPLVLQYDPARWSTLQIRLYGNNFDDAIKVFEAKWKTLEQSKPLKYQIYSFALQSAYQEMLDISRIIGFLAVLVFAISILGLLGIATYTTETRAKEIGLRKILGAKLSTLIVLLSRQYIMIIAGSALLFVPLGLYLSNTVLNSFAYHIDAGISLALPAVSIVFLVMGFTVGLQAYRAATKNPVESLRYE